jgi:hypothetical protein
MIFTRLNNLRNYALDGIENYLWENGNDLLWIGGIILGSYFISLQ